MFSPETDHLVNKERHKDRLRELEHQQLIRTAEGQPPGNEGRLGQVVGWVRNRLVAWGSKMQRNIPVHHQALSRRR